MFVVQCLIWSLLVFIVGLFDAFKWICAEPLKAHDGRKNIYFKAFAFFLVPQETLRLLAKLVFFAIERKFSLGFSGECKHFESECKSIDIFFLPISSHVPLGSVDMGCIQYITRTLQLFLASSLLWPITDKY